MADTTPIRTDSETDSVLVQRFLKSGDEAAFSMLVRRYERLVMGVCRRVLSDQEDAEDAFQATFMVLARSAKKIRKKASVSSWLYGVAYRVAIRAARKRYRRREASLDDPILQDDNPFENVSRRHEARAVDEELNRLPDSMREPLVLHYLSGQTSPEIARVLGLSVSAVEGRLKRGRKQLGQLLARRGIGPLSIAVITCLTAREAQAAASETLISRVIAQGVATHASSTSGNGESNSGSSGHETANELAREEVLQMSMLSQKAMATIGVTVAIMGVTVAGFLPQLIGQDGGAGALAAKAETLVMKSSPEPAQEAVETTVESTQESGLELSSVDNSSGTSIGDARMKLRDIERKLEEPVTADFVETPMSDVVDYLSQNLSMPILVDEMALEEVGLTPEDIVVTIYDVGTLTARSVLRLALAKYELTYVIEDEVLKITTPEKAEARPDVRVYSAESFGDQDMDSIIRLITNMVEVDSWDEVGGPGHIEAFGGKIIVSQTQEVHEKIRDLIAQLREAGAAGDPLDGLIQGSAR